MLGPGFPQRLLLALVLAAAGSGVASAGASAWTPPVTVSGATTGADAPSVGIAADQSSVLVWKHTGVSSSLVQSRGRSPEGAWGPVVNVASGDQPAMAVNAAGTAAIIWRRATAFGAPLFLTLRAADGTMTAPVEISGPGTTNDVPAVGIAADGTVVAAWRESWRVMHRVRLPDGRLRGGFEVGGGGGGALAPRVRMAPSGAAVIVWQRIAGNETAIEAVTIAAGGTVMGQRPPAPAGTSQSPDAGVDDDGDSIVVWQRLDAGTDRVEMRTVSAGGALGPVELVSSAASSGTQPAVAVNPSGAATFAWRSLEGGTQRIRAVQRSAGGTFGTRQLLSSAGVDARSPDIDLSAAGRAVVVWDRPSDTTYVQARSLFADGSRGSLVTAGTTSASAAGQPAVDVNETGGSAMAWLRFDGSSTRLRAAFGLPAGG